MALVSVRTVVAVLLLLLPVVVVIAFPERPTEGDSFAFDTLSPPPPVTDPIAAGELVRGSRVTQALKFDLGRVSRLKAMSSNETLCLDLLLANYSNRPNRGQVEIGLRQGSTLAASRLDVSQVADNATARVCFDEADWDELRPGAVELFIAGIDGEPGASITAWLTTDVQGGRPAAVNGVATAHGLVYGLVVRKWEADPTAARWAFVAVYVLFVGLLLWQLVAARREQSGGIPAAAAGGNGDPPRTDSAKVAMPLAERHGEGRRLFIQIPCFNEAASLSATLSDLPRAVAGFAQVEWLIVDDGSTDGTARVAREHGVDHIVRHTCNQGLASAFMTGLATCVRLGADVIVNTDADNQYRAGDIPALVAPILDGRADIVVGARPIEVIRHFSPIKKALQRLGSWVVRVASSTDIPDAPSGFRAMTREAAQRLVVFNNYTYTLETIIQAGQNNMAITSVPIGVNPDLRPSRLMRNMPSYVLRSLMTIVRIFVIYRPFRSFALVGGILFLAGFLLGLRFLYHYLGGHGAGHVQSLILASILLGMGFQTLLVAFVADLLAANRKLLEDIRFTQNRDRDLPPARSGAGA